METLLDDPFLRPLWSKLGHLPPLLRAWDGLTLGDIATRFMAPAGARVSKALLDRAESIVAPVLGDAAADALTQRLTRSPSVLSANYHAVECFPEMVQAIHFFALGDLLAPRCPTNPTPPVVPILSCSSVSLQSQTYPRGLMLARQDATTGAPLRLPFFPSALQDVMTGHAPALDPDGLGAMRAQWAHGRWQALTPWERDAVDEIMDKHVLRRDILDLPTFGAQVTRANASLCAARYAQASRPLVIYLEMEHLVSGLLDRDLDRTDSVMHRVVFDPEIRSRVLEGLAGVRGCWKTEAVNGLALGRTGRAGTIFFWLADQQGRRCPLRLGQGPGSEACLEYKNIRIPLRPDALRSALAGGRIVPSLFTSYVSLTLDHGLRCFGGIFLADYLPAMIRGVLAVMNGQDKAALAIHNPLAALPLGVRIESESGLFPAGTVELTAAGGLGRDHLLQLSRLTLADVLPLSLSSWYREYVPAASRPVGWATELDRVAARWRGVIVRPR